MYISFEQWLNVKQINLIDVLDDISDKDAFNEAIDQLESIYEYDKENNTINLVKGYYETIEN